jgi:long-chain acyl-CoA synthetase
VKESVTIKLLEPTESGKRVSCRQIGDHLLEFESLLEARVVGVPNEILGEAVKAYVVLRNCDSFGLEECLQDFCKMHMPQQLVPREIVVLQSLPKKYCWQGAQAGSNRHLAQLGR